MFNSRNNKLVPAINLVICTVLQRDTGSLDLFPELNIETNPGPKLYRISLFWFVFLLFRSSDFSFLLTFSINISFRCFPSLLYPVRAKRQRSLYELIPCLLAAPLMLLWRLERHDEAISCSTTAKFGEEN